MCPHHRGSCPGPGPSTRARCLQCQAAFLAAPAPVVAAPVAVVAAPALPVALAAVQGVAAPRVHPRRVAGNLGVGEQFNLTANPAPPAGTQLKWHLSGDAELSNESDDGGALFTAGPTRGAVTLKLKVKNGPHAGHMLSLHNFTVLEPTGTQTRQQPGTNLRHSQNTAGVGFRMWANLLPATVPFDGVPWREHTGLGMGTGHFAIENGRIHAPTGVAYNPATNQPMNQLAQTWMTVFANPGGGWGFNRIGQIDTVDTGDHAPNTPAAGAAPARWAVSSHHWNIEWKYRVRTARGWSGEKVLERVMHEAKIDANGNATIKKGNAGPFNIAAANATSNF
jgi:hypothetical protein